MVCVGMQCLRWFMQLLSRNERPLRQNLQHGTLVRVVIERASVARDVSSGTVGTSFKHAWPFTVEAVGPVACGALVWKLGTRLRATVVVQATFELQPGAFMRLVSPEPVVVGDVPYAGNAAHSLQLATDLVPVLRKADVLLTGHAYAPAGTETKGMAVRLCVARQHMLLDKTIHVFGDERGTKPFRSMPLVYERAYGGPNAPDNPVGTGAMRGSAAPNLIHPTLPSSAACFGPLRRDWAARASLLHGVEPSALEAHGLSLPTSFDMTFFQAAPLDQRIEYFHGDEWIWLDGFSAAVPRLRSQLPLAVARARIWGHPEAVGGQSIELVADTLRIDTDRNHCSLIWRGGFALPSEAALSTLHVIAGVQTNAYAPPWPEAWQRLEQEASGGTNVTHAAASPNTRRPSSFPPPPSQKIGSHPHWDTTMRIDGPADASTQRLHDTVALDESDLTPVDLNATAALDESAMAGPAKLSTTMALDERAVEAGRQRAPGAFKKGPPTLPPAAVAMPRQSLGQTVALDESKKAEAKSRPVIPFGPVAVAEAEPDIEIEVDTSELEPVPDKPRERAERPFVMSSGIRIYNDTPLTCAIVPWGLQPSRACLSVVVKATADIVLGHPANLRPHADEPSGEVTIDEENKAVVVYPSDLVPFKVRTDVVVVGHACAPGGEATPEVDVEVHFGDDENAFVRKLRAFGNRTWHKGPRGIEASAPEPFTRLSLRWERAFGGPGFVANPVGVGLLDRSPGARGPGALANLEDPESPVRLPSQKPMPICFGPVPFAWGARRSATGAKTAPWPFLPEDLDWTKFQAAPPEQRLAFLRGNERFSVVGMNSTQAQIEGSLPGIRPRCFAVRENGGAFDEVPLVLDTVVLMMDTSTIEMVFRGWLPVPDEAHPGIAALHIATESVEGHSASLGEMRAALLGKANA